VQSDVQVISEYPSGFGFAKSARKITRKFKYEAWDVTKDQTKNFYPMINVIRFDTSMPLKQKEKFDRLVDEASNNSAKAQFALANFLSPVYGVVTVPPPEYFNKNYRYKIPENKLQGNKLLLNAAVNGNAQAQAYLGMRLIIGRDVEMDTTKGLNWLKQAVANGSEYAKKQLELLE